MKSPVLVGRVLGVVCVAVIFCCMSPAAVNADLKTTITTGTLTRTNTHSDLNLVPGDVIYAINNSGNPAAQTIDGVNFVGNQPGPLGYSDSAPAKLNNWDADSATLGPDAGAMNNILNDIDCCGGPHSYSFAVPDGTYKLQAFWQGNAENRLWDIEVEGALAVDEVSSNGEWLGGPQPNTLDDNSMFTIFEQTVTIDDGFLDLRMGQIFSDGNELGADRNYVLSGLVVSNAAVVPEPSSFLLWGIMGLVGLVAWRFRRRR